MRTVPAILATLLVMLGGAASVRADVYYLKDGGKIEGKGEDLGDRIRIHVPLGAVTVLKSEILRVVRKKSILDLYQDELVQAARTADGRYQLALWCESAGLHRQVRKHLREVLAIDPNHSEARKRLGYRSVGNRWMTDDEWHEWKGDIRFRGSWMPPETVAAILQAEALQKKLAQRQQAAGKPQGGQGKQATPVGANPAKQGKGPGNNGGQGGQGVLLSRSLRPSKRFLDKYFVTNPFNYGSAGARIHYGGQYDATTGNYVYGPVYYGPYSYDGMGGGYPASGIYVNGAYSGSSLGSSYSAYSGRGEYGGLHLFYTINKPGDAFFAQGGLEASQGFNSFVGHSFFGSFRAGKSRVSFSFK